MTDRWKESADPERGLIRIALVPRADLACVNSLSALAAPPCAPVSPRQRAVLHPARLRPAPRLIAEADVEHLRLLRWAAESAGARCIPAEPSWPAAGWRSRSPPARRCCAWRDRGRGARPRYVLIPGETTIDGLLEQIEQPVSGVFLRFCTRLFGPTLLISLT